MVLSLHMKVNTDPNTIDEILSRSIDSIYPSRQQLKELLLSGKQLRIYVGIDPTADYVHIGHSTNYLILERLHQLGHKIIVLVGDFTAMIGDPSDKSAARVKLTKEEVKNNLKSFKSQIGNILNFNDKKNPIEFAFNSKWLAKLSFADSVELASNFTVQQMLERDAFEKRVNENKPLYVHEFFYPLMQGYDSVALDVDLEIGGTDQTFNMLAGRTLQKRYKNKEKFVMTTTLLVNPVTQEKMMSKSQGTGIALNETPENMYGKTMALPDEGIIQTFIDCTRLSMQEIVLLKDELKKGVNPKEIKMKLARELVTMYHNAKKAEAAEQQWIETFSQGKPQEGKKLHLTIKAPLVDILVQNGFVASKSEFRRLLQEGAIKVIVKQEEKKIVDPNTLIEDSTHLKIGKKKFLTITFQKKQ